MGSVAGYNLDYFKVSFPAEYVIHVEINRPEKMNAFIETMWLNLATIFNKISHDPNVRCAILSGSGDKAFTTGLDVQAASQGPILGSAAPGEDTARRGTALRRHILEFQDCITSLERCEKPVITLLHGHAYGLAIDMSLATTIRLAAANTRFCVKEVDIGLAADIGTLSRLPKAVGSFSWCNEVCLTARVFGAEEALRVGLVSGLFKDKAEGVRGAVEMATLISAKSPVAVQGTKEILGWSRDRGVEDGLKYTAVWNAAMLQTSDVKSALLSGLQKRKPTFEKL
ncbi:ClpP/crotonase [Aulographum hederae CBS 113979]|uniref:ClpP/crotonase n=1 Tax=Aulographum hederae CBS 113979 TaxID=1176131 RepID=A0A6G1GZ77_9PEZI|nr:ClpP/crotonase [Aulographum hederae CBS 113979]